LSEYARVFRFISHFENLESSQDELQVVIPESKKDAEMMNISSDDGSPDSEVVTEVSKKKLHFTATEKSKLLKLVNEYKYVLEDKKYDLGSINKKQKAWDDLTKHFCSQPGVTKRTSKQLQTWWNNSKKRARKQMAIHKMPREVNPEVERILTIFPNLIKLPEAEMVDCDLENNARTDDLQSSPDKDSPLDLSPTTSDITSSSGAKGVEFCDDMQKQKNTSESSSLVDMEYKEHRMRMKILEAQLEEAKLNKQIAAKKLMTKRELWLIKIKHLKARRVANINKNISFS